jgi:hypothetical protein
MHPLALPATGQPTTNGEASAPGGSARTVNTAEATATAASEAAAEAGTFVVAATAGLEADTDNQQDEEKLNAPITLLTVNNTVF